jgi:hypothetical protein
VLATALLLTAQAIAIWNVLEPKLDQLSRTRIKRAFGGVGHPMRWDVSIVPPRVSDLIPLASIAERLRFRMLAIANQYVLEGPTQVITNRRGPQDVDILNASCSATMSVRLDDLSELTAVLNGPALIDGLRDEIVRCKNAPLLHSRSWLELWRISDQLVRLLEQVWRRCIDRDVLPARTDALQLALGTAEHATSERRTIAERWFVECEEFVALQYAFVLRDVLARIMSSLFGAMLCLTLLTAGHLFYLFQGRAALLTVDLLAVALAAAAAIRIVIGMERDWILSQLRLATPGRNDFNWEFVRRIGVYGLLPLIAVIASLFPEIGDSLFSWLEPLRKLTTF